VITSYGGYGSGNAFVAEMILAAASSDRRHGRWGVKRRTRHTLILLSVPTLLLLALGGWIVDAPRKSPGLRRHANGSVRSQRSGTHPPESR
jgi:hypothetical protein